MNKKIVCSLLSVVCGFTSLIAAPPSVGYAADYSVPAEILEIVDSDTLKSLSEVRTGYGVEYVDAAEFGYDGEENANYGFYIYVLAWNALNGSFDTSSFAVQISYADGSAVETKSLKVANVFELSSSKKIYKLKIPVSEIQSKRYYCIESVSVPYTGKLRITKPSGAVVENTITRDLKCDINRTFEFEGLEEKGKVTYDDVVSIDCHYTYYRHMAEGDESCQQMDTVYFAIPDTIENNWGSIKSISYEYDVYRTSPMVVWKKSAEDNHLKFLRQQVGKQITGGDLGRYNIDYDIGLCWGHYYPLAEVPYYTLFDNVYNDYYPVSAGNNKVVKSCVTNAYDWDYSASPRYINRVDRLAYSFVSSSDDLNVDYFPGDSILEYIYNYVAPETKSKIYIPACRDVAARSYSTDLFEDPYSSEYGHKNVVTTSEDYAKIEIYKDKQWWNPFTWFASENRSSNALTAFKEEEYNELYSNGIARTGTSGNLFINEFDLQDFGNFCSQAYANNEVPYILRFRTSNYYASTPGGTLVCGMAGGVKGSFGHCYVAQEDVYFNFNVIDFTVEREGEAKTFKVDMTPIDAAADLEPGKGNTGSNVSLGWLNDLWNSLKWILGIIGGILLFLVLWPVFKAIVALISALTKKKSSDKQSGSSKKNKRRR